MSRPAILPWLLVNVVVCACWGLDGWLVSVASHQEHAARWCIVGVFALWPVVMAIRQPWTCQAQGATDERALAWALAIFIVLMVGGVVFG